MTAASPVAHSLGKGPARSLVLTPVRTGREQRKTLNSGVSRGQRPVLPSSVREVQLLFPVHDAPQGPGGCRENVTVLATDPWCQHPFRFHSSTGDRGAGTHRGAARKAADSVASVRTSIICPTTSWLGSRTAALRCVICTLHKGTWRGLEWG